MGAVSFFLVFLAIVLIGATLWAGTGGPRGILRRFRRNGAPDDGAPAAETDPATTDPAGPDPTTTNPAGPDPTTTNPAGPDPATTVSAGTDLAERGLLTGGFEQPPANLPPVLLPAEASPADIDRIRFSLGLRGYRMDQVDQVLDELRDQLAAKDEEVARLRARLLETERVARPEPGA